MWHLHNISTKHLCHCPYPYDITGYNFLKRKKFSVLFYQKLLTFSFCKIQVDLFSFALLLQALEKKVFVKYDPGNLV